MTRLRDIAILFLFSVTIAGCQKTSEPFPSAKTEVTRNMIKVKALGVFNVNNSLCSAQVNGMRVADNFRFGPIMSTGLNVTPWLENGENDISVYFASLDARKGISKHRLDAQCDFILESHNRQNSIELTSITASSDEKGNPTAELSKQYPEMNHTSDVEEVGYVYNRVFEIKRHVKLNNLPEWSWTKATPFPDTPENRLRLEEAYKQLSRIFANNDFETFKKAIWLSMEERAMADGLDPEFYFETTGYPQQFEKGTSASDEPLDWSRFKFESFRGGRLVRLADISGLSPAEYKNSEGTVISFRPYFSLIDDKLVITR